MHAVGLQRSTRVMILIEFGLHCRAAHLQACLQEAGTIEPSDKFNALKTHVDSEQHLRPALHGFKRSTRSELGYLTASG
jgi:hypothetical protein